MANGQRVGDILTVREVARLLRVHPNNLTRRTNKGDNKGATRRPERGDRGYKCEGIARFLRELRTQADNSEKATEVEWL